MTQNFNESNILICGSPRVGKSTLINAICQENVAKSSRSLSSTTTSIDQYSFENSFGDLTHRTIFWDTPGIDSWCGDDAQNYMIELIERIQPICMIYCASPGSFAGLDNLAWMISECHRRNIFCALVCTNMWVGQNRQSVVNELCQVLNTVHPDLQSNKEDGVIYYGNVALVTMVNSTEYIDDDFGVRKPVSGIDELIFGIAKCLERDDMFAWLRTVSKNKSFWTKMSSKIGDLFNTVYQHAENIFEYLFTLRPDNKRSINLLMKTTSIDDNNTEPVV
jgi:hypothetical protein